ncbi:spore coat protein CotH [Alkalihalobacillus alcalophilus ATCC 27647 = CGMCC 1.3604]|uniref:Spore coat protein CotH n=2 Tax=Alkalihalobacillus alcalophilus ATCC 27647 = CGMCC 1.3604 TaxID=1218173 RepID=A0A4S4K3X5_ALKAL|nr:spore coat protein [Alkalihalobacillus alcalophilus]MED1561803.1 spore coat protein [Alkalihalobacillus alcalophilus]THG90769.1 spore coat protein CotH [Alkalihalobacillus alcalophilus ATCC 27647 = CGMCC 1.3604]
MFNHHCHKPANVCQKPTTTQVMPAVVHPTQQNIVQKTCEYIVPEVHPTHTTNVTNHVYKHVHSFPHTTSQQQTVTNQQFVGGPSAPVAGAMSPGFGGPVAGAMSPGFGPQWGHKHGGGCGCNR